jgi:hypothetical protein
MIIKERSFAGMQVIEQKNTTERWRNQINLVQFYQKKIVDENQRQIGYTGMLQFDQVTVILCFPLIFWVSVFHFIRQYNFIII